mmetsp:Transcript_37203/g.64252  ORF Transcript_37203/g.64252 Transcript_37203/m.64252 type:complete len:223 (+) Transcript_37203:1963-2631(+)
MRGFEPMPRPLIPPALTPTPLALLSTERLGIEAMPPGAMAAPELLLFTVTTPAVLMLLKPFPAIKIEVPRPFMPPPRLPRPPPRRTCTCTKEGAVPGRPGTVRCTCIPPIVTTFSPLILVAPGIEGLRGVPGGTALAEAARLLELPEAFSLYCCLARAAALAVAAAPGVVEFPTIPNRCSAEGPADLTGGRYDWLELLPVTVSSERASLCELPSCALCVEWL